MNLPSRRLSNAENPRTVRPRPISNFRAFRVFRGSFLFSVFSFFCGSLLLPLAATHATAQDLASLETAIRTGTTEQKREALFQIRNLRSEMASRAAVPALNDADPTVRATSASSVVFLPNAEAITVLSPLLADKEAFVRKEAAYALGKVESPDAAPQLIELLAREKDLEVKAAVAFALGQTGNRVAVEPLIEILRRKPDEDEEFLRRAASRSIGQIAQIIKIGKERVVTPQNFLPEKYKQLTADDLTAQIQIFNSAATTLKAVLQNQREADDTRREAAFALGAIGSPDSISTLESYRNSSDPYLAEITREALAKISSSPPVN